MPDVQSSPDGFTSEADLAAHVIAYLSTLGATVYQDVQLPGWSAYPDIVAIWRTGPSCTPGGTPIAAGELWIVETKRHLGLDVMAQAFEAVIH